VRERSEERRPLEILLVEDNLPDARLIVEVLMSGPIPKTVRVSRDGKAAVALLRDAKRDGAGPVPDLLILDLNLPGMDGREVLADIKSDPDLLRIPVVVLTTSSAESDVLRAYALHANCYLVKPIGLDAFTSVVQEIEHFWLSLAQLPVQNEKLKFER